MPKTREQRLAAQAARFARLKAEVPTLADRCREAKQAFYQAERRDDARIEKRCREVWQKRYGAEAEAAHQRYQALYEPVLLADARWDELVREEYDAGTNTPRGQAAVAERKGIEAWLPDAREAADRAHSEWYDLTRKVQPCLNQGYKMSKVRRDLTYQKHGVSTVGCHALERALVSPPYASARDTSAQPSPHLVGVEVPGQWIHIMNAAETRRGDVQPENIRWDTLLQCEGEVCASDLVRGKWMVKPGEKYFGVVMQGPANAVFDRDVWSERAGTLAPGAEPDVNATYNWPSARQVDRHGKTGLDRVEAWVQPVKQKVLAVWTNSVELQDRIRKVLASQGVHLPVALKRRR